MTSRELLAIGHGSAIVALLVVGLLALLGLLAATAIARLQRTKRVEIVFKPIGLKIKIENGEAPADEATP